MQPARILLVEDEPGIAELLALNLREGGFAMTWARDGENAERQLAAALPDAVLLDWMLPDASGLDLARRWRASEHTRQLPILMLTARVDDADKVAALDGGADDYVTKPFSPGELLARIRALLRRRGPRPTSDTFNIAGLQLDGAAHRVFWRGRMLRLGPAEFRLLHFLMQHPEEVHSRIHLLDRVWGKQVQLDERTIDVHIKRLRESLGPARDLVETVRGVGYRITAQPLDPHAAQRKVSAVSDRNIGGRIP